MKMQAFITIETKDKNGQLKFYSKKEANSLVRGFIDTLQAQMSDIAVVAGWTDTGNTNRNTASNVQNFRVNSGAGVVTHGIVVGTGVAAVAITDYALGTLIAHGVGAGQLNYGLTSVGVMATVGTSREFTVARTVTNNSGADITVNEVGIYSYITAAWYVCLDRTLNTFVVGNGLASTVTYTLRVTV